MMTQAKMTHKPLFVSRSHFNRLEILTHQLLKATFLSKCSATSSKMMVTAQISIFYCAA